MLSWKVNSWETHSRKVLKSCLLRMHHKIPDEFPKIWATHSNKNSYREILYILKTNLSWKFGPNYSKRKHENSFWETFGNLTYAFHYKSVKIALIFPLKLYSLFIIVTISLRIKFVGQLIFLKRFFMFFEFAIAHFFSCLNMVLFFSFLFNIKN